MSVGSSAFLLTVIFIVIFCIVGFILDHFGDRATYKWYVWVTTIVSYFLPFTIIVMLPLDLASNCDEPWIDAGPAFLYGFWQTMYWISFNIQMYAAQTSYCTSGSFTSWQRLKDGIMENVWFYASIVLPAIPFLLYAIFGLEVPVSKLIDLAIPAMNSYGLILLVLLMSYGLVEIPRGLWFESSVEWRLRYLEATAPSLKESCVDSEAEMYEVARLAALAATKIPENDALRPMVDTILEKCPLALNERHAALEEASSVKFTALYLASLHARIKRAHFVNKRQQAKLKSLYQDAFFYQDVITNLRKSDKCFESAFWKFPVPEGPYKKPVLQAAWWWYCVVQPIAMKALGVLCMLFTVLIVWSESTFQFSSVRLSIPFYILDDRHNSYFSVEILSMCFLCYMCACTYSSLLKLKLFDFFEMVPNHMTDEPSLLFVGAYLCKLTFPLCYNYLNMGGVTVAEDNDYSNFPVFIQFLGPAVNMTPLLGEGYNDWVAFLILIVCLVYGLNLHNRIARLFGASNYFYESFKSGMGDPEGRQILEQARTVEVRRMQRAEASGPSTGSGQRARNTADLLAKYSARDTSAPASAGGPSKTGNTSPGASRSTRAFGNYGFGKPAKSKNGYSQVDNDE
ncbi:LMBR1 domain-containing protein 2 [Kappamyces sp. JEL0829]|nr:LMBR1 domain-containing protein 2 [Kappamyces sp. JEL0829]